MHEHRRLNMICRWLQGKSLTVSLANRVIIVCIIKYGVVWKSVLISDSSLFCDNFILKEDREMLLSIGHGVRIKLLMYA